MKRCILFTTLSFLLFKCGNPQELPPDKYVRWVESEDHGLIHKKEVKNVGIMVKYLPSEYLAYREFISRNNELEFDTIWTSYKCGLTFHITLTADQSDPTYSNLMYYNVFSPEELAARTRFLSFNIQEFISIRLNNVNYEPILSHFEGFDQLGNKIGFQVSFILPEYNCGNTQVGFDDLTLIFDDPFWELGTNYFQFDKSKFTDIPKMQR